MQSRKFLLGLLNFLGAKMHAKNIPLPFQASGRAIFSGLCFALPIFHLSEIKPSTAVKAHFIATMPDLFSPASGGANAVTRLLEGSRFGKIRWLLSIKSFYLE